MADLSDSAFLAVCRGERPSHTPVWFMRQAGRSLPEYKAVRGEGSINQAIADPERATEITLQPVRRYGVDAAILFSDIVTAVHAIGFGIDIKPGVGPVAEHPIRSRDDLARLRPLEPDADIPYVLETVRNLVAELGVPLIGFAGAPFTVASYLIEGGPSKNKTKTKSMMLDDPELFAEIMDRLADQAIATLRAQVANGASAVQLFDSWAGCLSPSMYERSVMPASRKIFDAVADLGVPRIHFGINTGELLTRFRDAGADVVGVDWLVPLDVARDRLGPDAILQGNLDPVVCLAEWPSVEAAVREVLARNGGHPGHIFNLGHGVLPETNPAILERVVDLVHEEGQPGEA
ncbi:MAG: uroporphyrinogen decarboxylase [Actinomycetota bacterium]